VRGLLNTRSAFWRGSKVCTAIVANVGQKESGVVEGVEVCGWEVGVCRSGEGMGDSAGNGTVRWHV